MRLQTQKNGGEVEINQVISDDSWVYHLGPFENGDWCSLENKTMQKEWKQVSIRGYPPQLNGWLFTPDLVKGKSLTEDLFGLRSSLVHMLLLFSGKKIAQIIRWLFRLDSRSQ